MIHRFLNAPVLLGASKVNCGEAAHIVPILRHTFSSTKKPAKSDCFGAAWSSLTPADACPAEN